MLFFSVKKVSPVVHSDSPVITDSHPGVTRDGGQSSGTIHSNTGSLEVMVNGPDREAVAMAMLSLLPPQNTIITSPLERNVTDGQLV